MSCLEPADIRRYVQGSMADREADAVTEHLVGCRVCRQAVAELRGNTDPEGEEAAAAEPVVKVTCEKCSTRYGIPESRVRGRTLKIRCKKCKTVIEVRSAQGRTESVVDGGKKVWFVVIRRQRIGPMTAADVRQRFEEGEIRARTYVWRQGFAKWERLADVAELQSLLEGGASSAPPGAGAAAAAANASPDTREDPALSLSDAHTDLRVPRPAAGEHEESSTGQVTHVHLGGGDPMAGLSMPGVVGDVLTSTDEQELEEQATFHRLPPPSSRRKSPRLDRESDWEQRMKAQRHDDSVLFSLSHLQRLAAVPKDGGGDEDGPSKLKSSGLFEIRPMLGAPAAPLLMPEVPTRGGPHHVGVVLGVAVAGVVLGAAVLLGLLHLVQPRLVRALFSADAEQPGAVAGAGGPAAAGGQSSAAAAALARAGTATAAARAPAASPLKPDAAGPVDAAVVATSAMNTIQPLDLGARSRQRSRRARPHRRAAARRVARPAPARPAPSRKSRSLLAGPAGGTDDLEDLPAELPKTPAPRAKAPAPRGKSGPSELDDLIDKATGPGGAAGRPAPAPRPKPAPSAAPRGSGLPKTLSRQQVSAGMRRAGPAARFCYQQFLEPGTVMVSATIDGSTGRVVEAKVLGKFADTATGECVLDAVRQKTKFPRFDGPPLTLKYPYMLR